MSKSIRPTASFANALPFGPCKGTYDVVDDKGAMTTICVRDEELSSFLDNLKREFGGVDIFRMADNRANLETLFVIGKGNPEGFEIEYAVDYEGEWHRLTRFKPVFLT